MPIKDKNLFKLIEKIISLLQTNHHTEYEEYQKISELSTAVLNLPRYQQ